MTTITFRNQVVAIVATVLVSATCLVGAVGPAATAGSSNAPVTARAIA